MPSWKINCLKSEENVNPSTLSSNTTDETNQIDSISSAIDRQDTGKYKFYSYNRFEKSLT